MQPLRLLIKHRNILWAVSRNSIKSRYAGSTLGLIWAFIYPMLFLAVYSAVFIGILKVRMDQFVGIDYILLIFCALVPWFGFSESLGSGVSSVTNNTNLIRNTLFPIELIPVQSVIVSSVTQVVGLSILLIFLSFKGFVGMASFFIIISFVFQLFFTIGLIWLLSALNVLIRDIGQIIPVFILMLMLVSPIGYTEEMIPEQMLPYMKFNPLYFMVALYREPLMFNRLPDLNIIIIFGLLSILVFYSGYWVFRRLKGVFSDYV